MPMDESPRIRRLRKDYERLKNLVNNSDLIRIENISGNPPEIYVIHFACRGIAIDANGTAVISEDHRVKIELHKEYPVKAPHLIWMTEIFHPNFSNTSVCINDKLWSPEQRLDDLVIMLGRMIQFQHFNVDSPLDSSAAVWAAAHRLNLPIDNRPLHRGVIDRVDTNPHVIKIHIK